MRYRRFGNSRPRGLRGRLRHLDARQRLVGSTSTTSTAMMHAALDAGINFIDTAPVYGDDGVGETLLADVLDAHRDEHRPHHEVRLRHRRRAQVPGPVGAPARLAAGVDPRRSSKTRCAASAPTTSTCTSCTTRASSRSSTTTSGTTLDALAAEGKVRELGVALGPAIGWVEEGIAVDRRPADRVAADRVQRARAGARAAPSRASRRSPTARSGSSRACRTRPTRCRARSRPTPCSRPATTARTATATTCSTTSRRPRRCRSSGRAPAARSGQAAIAGILANPAFTTVLPDRASTSTTCASTRRRPTSRSPPTRRAQLDDAVARNFDHDDRYEMPLKSSV